MAEAAADAGIKVIDMGRGQKEYKDKLKTGHHLVGEGRVARMSAGASVHWMVRVPVRKARGTVLGNPVLLKTADRALKAYGKLRTTFQA